MTASPSSPTPQPAPAPGSPPAPTPPKAKQPRKRGTWLVALVALAVSLLSLVVAVASLASARAARDEAADAEQLAEALSQAGSGGPPPATSGPVDAPATTEPPPTDGTQETVAPPQTLNPQAAFTVKYSGEVLNPQVTSSGDTYIDLDEPRVVFDRSQADLVLEYNGLRSDPPYFDLQQSDVTAAEAASPEATPEDCLQQIRTGPLPLTAEVPAQRGTVLCLLTSPTRAAEQGINQKLAVLHVSALGDEGSVTIGINAWEQPR